MTSDPRALRRDLPLHRFLTRIRFKHALTRDLRVVQRNHRDRMSEILLALLYPLVLGLERLDLHRVVHHVQLPNLPEPPPQVRPVFSSRKDLIDGPLGN